MQIALFGGSFNPPHVGHLLSAAYVRAVSGVDAVWLMPAHRHAFNKPLAPWADRVRMCRALASLLTGVEVTEVEALVPGEGRTVDTVEHLKRTYPGHAFRLVIGTDILAETDQWKAFDRLVELAPPFVLGRSGYDKPEVLPAGLTWLGQVPMPEVSSSDVRRRLAQGDDASSLVPSVVLELVRELGLYGRDGAPRV